MLVTVLVTTVACSLLVLGAALVRAVAFRRRLLRTDGVFRCKVRLVEGTATGLPRRWPRRASPAEWMHDVLLVHRGYLLTWTQPLGVRLAEAVIEPVRERVALGDSAVALQLRVDGGAVIEVAAPVSAREQLAGPFLSIAVQGLPPGKKERRY